MTASSRTTAGIAHDRAGPRGDLPVVLLHAGIADRRMWDPIWSALAVELDVFRLDFRGFGESTTRPRGMLSPVDVHEAARLVAAGVAGARLVNWPDTAHLPSMERPDDFLAVLRDWLASAEPPRRIWTAMKRQDGRN